MTDTATELRKPVVEPTHMRDAMAAVPTCVTVVAGDRSGPTAAMVMGSFVSISLVPALVGFFVVLDSTSWPILRECSRLGISVLSEEHRYLVSEITKKDPNRFEDSRWVAGPNGEMLVDGALTHITGAIDSIKRVGDHDFVVLSVESISSGPEGGPLIFQGRKLQALGN